MFYCDADTFELARGYLPSCNVNDFKITLDDCKRCIRHRHYNVRLILLIIIMIIKLVGRMIDLYLCAPCSCNETNDGAKWAILMQFLTLDTRNVVVFVSLLGEYI